MSAEIWSSLQEWVQGLGISSAIQWMRCRLHHFGMIYIYIYIYLWWYIRVIYIYIHDILYVFMNCIYIWERDVYIYIYRKLRQRCVTASHVLPHGPSPFPCQSSWTHFLRHPCIAQNGHFNLGKECCLWTRNKVVTVGWASTIIWKLLSNLHYNIWVGCCWVCIAAYWPLPLEPPGPI